jgi:hypothetical protein
MDHDHHLALAFLDEGTAAGWRENAAEAEALGADLLYQRALRHQLDLEILDIAASGEIVCNARPRKSRSASAVCGVRPSGEIHRRHGADVASRRS